MRRAGRSSTGENETAGKTVIANVQNQLKRGFLPAVKTVADTSAALLKAHLALQTAAEAHIDALKALVESGETAEKDAEKHAKALKWLALDYQNLIDLHKKTLPKLNYIATKTATHSQGEKDKQKELTGEHLEREKAVLKAVKKGSKSDEDLASFYEKEAAMFARQQEHRYKFFIETHLQWFQSYAPLVEFGNKHLSSSKTVDKEYGAVTNGDRTEEAASPTPPAEQKDDDHVTVVEQIKEKEEEKEKKDEAEMTPQEETGVLSSSTPTPVEEAEYAEIRKEEKQSEAPFAEPSAKQSGGGNYIEQARARGVAVPVLPFGMLGQQQLKPVSPTTAPPRQMVEEGVQAELPVPTPDYVVHSTAPPPLFVSAPSYDTGASSPPHHGYNAIIPPPTSPKPLVSPERVPSRFRPSDYKSVLIVTQDFFASDGGKLTVSAGDKVILMNAGTRSWIFVRDCVSQRTGWIPEDYVEFESGMRSFH